MAPIANFQPTYKPPVVAASFADTEADLEQLATHHVARRYQLAPHIAQLVCRLADLGQREAA